MTLSLQFIGTSLGTGVAVAWWPYLGLSVLGLLLISAAALVWVWYSRPQERCRALGLLLFLGAIGSLALGIGWGRAGLDMTAGFSSRYLTLGLPGLCGIYLIWVTYAGTTVGRFVQMALFILTCMVFVRNVQLGVERGATLRQQMQNFEKDLLDGMPADALAQRYIRIIFPDSSVDPAGELAGYLRMLREAGIGKFGRLQDYPPHAEVPVPLVPVEINQMTWKDGTGTGSGGDPYLVFALEQPQWVYGIRIRCAYQNTPGPAYFQMFWRRSDRNDFTDEERNVVLQLDTTSGEQTKEVVVNDTIDQIRIDPDMKPCVFRLSEIVLLVAPLDQAGADKESSYGELVQQVREAVAAAVPAGATVAVVSKGDNDLIRLPGRTGWHFPQQPDGRYLGYNPERDQAVALLEAVRAKGGQYLVFPRPAFWWLDYYEEFKQHLDARYLRVRSDRHCIIYRLSEPAPAP